MIVIGFNSPDAQIKDIAIKITHNMFMSNVHVHNMSIIHFVKATQMRTINEMKG